MLCFSLPVQPSQADKHASPSPACQFAVCWTYIFINLTLTKLFTILQGQPLPGVTAQSSTEVRQLMTISASWGPAWEHWAVSDALIPHEARFILDSCPFSGQLSAWRGLHCFTKYKWMRVFLSRSFCIYFCRKFFESGFNWEGKGKDKLIILKRNFLAELFIAPSASVPSGVLLGEMPLKQTTSMPLCLFFSRFRSTMFPFFLHLLRELWHINCRAYSFTKIPC